MCGFVSLSREEKINRAHEILNSNDLKQTICNQILGTTFKDIDRAMLSIIKERQLTASQEEELELREKCPEKFEPQFDPEFEFKLNSTSESSYRTYTKAEVSALLEASNRDEFLVQDVEPPAEYPMMPRHFVEELMREYFSYKGPAKEPKEWDSQNTIELEQKTDTTKKRGKRSKA